MKDNVFILIVQIFKKQKHLEVFQIIYLLAVDTLTKHLPKNHGDSDV